MSGDPVFAALAARQPGAIILRGRDTDWNAIALQHAVDDFSDRLAGIRVLAVLADNSPQWAIADLAALRAGLVHLPLPAFFSPDQLLHALQATAVDAVLTDQEARIVMLDLGFERTGEWNGLMLMRRKVDAVRLPVGTAKVSFTSGSTGAPKGVCLSAAGLVATAQALATRLADIPVAHHLAVLPLALLLENVAGIYAPLLRGATIHLPALQDIGWRGMAGFDPAALQHTVAEISPHSLILVPEVLKAWTQYLAASGQFAPASLKYVAVGGARVAPRLLARARESGLPAYQGYGLTECGSVVSLNRPGDDGDAVGRPLDHVALRVVDGEVRVATPAFLGYLGDPVSQGTSEFATGDLGYLSPSGRLHLSGRRKNLLITSYGRNIAPEWVESVLLAQPEIAQAVVSGESRPWLNGILVPGTGVGDASLAQAVARANDALPAYARLGGWIAVAPFSPQNGQATGNGRPVRDSILNQHAAQLAALYRSEEPANVVL
jgi:long-subunit acyl-CoA synthetase (AMP-forming)